MHDIKDGKRTVLEMTGLLTNLSDQDLADIAAYFASQKMSVGMADPNLVAQGEALFRGGKIAEGMPACTGCIPRAASASQPPVSRTWAASTRPTWPSN